MISTTSSRTSMSGALPWYRSHFGRGGSGRNRVLDTDTVGEGAEDEQEGSDQHRDMERSRGRLAHHPHEPGVERRVERAHLGPEIGRRHVYAGDPAREVTIEIGGDENEDQCAGQLRSH